MKQKDLNGHKNHKILINALEKEDFANSATKESIMRSKIQILKKEHIEKYPILISNVECLTDAEKSEREIALYALFTCIKEEAINLPDELLLLDEYSNWEENQCKKEAEI